MGEILLSEEQMDRLCVLASQRSSANARGAGRRLEFDESTD